MRLAGLSATQVILSLAAVAAGAIGAFVIRRSLNPYAAAFPVAGVWLASIAFIAVGIIMAFRVQWRVGGVTLALVGASILVGFGTASVLVPPRELTMAPVIEGPIVRVQLRPDAAEVQVRSFLCEFVYSDCSGSSGQEFRPGVMRIMRTKGNELVIVTTPEYQQVFLTLVRRSPLVERAESGPV